MSDQDGDDRVRKNTAASVNEQIDSETSQSVAAFAGRSESQVSQRISDLDREWDVERWLEMNASALAFTGLILGITHHRRWLLVPGIVLPFLFQHAVQGWCPPLPILRRLGVRTREEIDREKYALKALRGDFGGDTITSEQAESAAR